MLQRRGTPVGGLALLCVVLAVPAQAAAPTPDPPPEAVAPEAPPVTTRSQPAQVREAPVTVAPTPVIRRAAPVVRAQPAQTPPAKPNPVVKRKSVAKPKANRVTRPAAATTVAAPVPHDRARLPVVALVTADELNQRLLAFGGMLLLVTTLSGGMVIWAGRRVLREGLL